MISSKELQKIAKARMRDASTLLKKKSYDGSMYICGYAIEIALKALICHNLNLHGIPHTSAEFTAIAKIKTHSLEDLLQQSPSQVSGEIKKVYLADWSNILKWNPEMRYAPIRGTKMREEAEATIRSARKVLKYLLAQI